MAVKWKWNNNAGGGNVPANLEQRIQAVETKATNNETNITNLTTNGATKQELNNKIQKRVIDITNTQGNTYTIQPANGYEIISVMVGRKRTSDGYYFFQYNTNLNFQLFLHTDGTYRIYTQGPVSGFDGSYRIIVVEKKL